MTEDTKKLVARHPAVKLRLSRYSGHPGVVDETQAWMEEAAAALLQVAAERDAAEARCEAVRKALEEATAILRPLARRYDETDYKPGESVCVPTPWMIYAKASAFIAKAEGRG